MTRESRSCKEVGYNKGDLIFQPEKERGSYFGAFHSSDHRNEEEPKADLK